MAQANSVQREPSMEEILASIRRIIEDSESGRKEDGPGTRGRGAAVGEVEAFRAEFKTVPAPEPETADNDDKVPAESELLAGEPDMPQYETPAQQAVPAEEDGAAEPTGTWHNSKEVRAEQPAAAPAEEPREWRVLEEAPHASRMQDAPPAAQPKASGEERAAILSDASGRKVAAAFGELSEAFEASRRKSLADAAEEMLRPMLQEWLDNNLPQLVERLVREEIERVARGG